MDYCSSDGDGSASWWPASLSVDVDGDGTLDGAMLDVDGDGLFDDALADLDGDGLADHAVIDVAGAHTTVTDDGTGTWTVGSAGMRWLGLDGVEHHGGPLVDFDGDGVARDRLVDIDHDGSADRVFTGRGAYVDTDGDGRWDLNLSDSDGDGAADAVSGAGRAGER